MRKEEKWGEADERRGRENKIKSTSIIHVKTHRLTFSVTMFS